MRQTIEFRPIIGRIQIETRGDHLALSIINQPALLGAQDVEGLVKELKRARGLIKGGNEDSVRNDSQVSGR